MDNFGAMLSDSDFEGEPEFMCSYWSEADQYPSPGERCPYCRTKTIASPPGNGKTTCPKCNIFWEDDSAYETGIPAWGLGAEEEKEQG